VSRVVVVGGGIGGLAVAARLARMRHDVTVVERSDSVGGKLGELQRDGFRFDTGPSWYLMPEVFDHFFTLMGTSTGEQLDLVTLDPGYRVFSEDGRPPLDIRADVAWIGYANEDLRRQIEPVLHRLLAELL